MMDFFDQQDHAKKITHYLIFLFGCAIAGTTGLLYAALLFTQLAFTDPPFSLWHPDYLIFSVVVVSLSVAFGSLQKQQALRGGGPVVAASLGGIAVDSSTNDLQQQILLNVVAEMAIAAGIPQPRVYILPDRGINAFAAGHTQQDAVVTVTQGALDRLNREELQGVVGHEFSYILNGDMALNLKLMGLVHGLLMLHIAGRKILYHTHLGQRSSSSSRNGMTVVIALGAGLTVGGAIGWLFGQMIKSGVSRQREFLADAAAVQFTRNPEGLASALKQIIKSGGRSRIASPNAPEASHLFFSPPIQTWSPFRAFATHPPLEERIKRLTGKRILRTAAVRPASVISAASLSSSLVSPLVPLQPTANHKDIPSESVSPSADVLVPYPELLVKAIQSQVGAVAIVYCLLLSENHQVRQRQKQQIGCSSAVALTAMEKIETAVEGVSERSRLLLLEHCVPMLKSLKPAIAAQCFRNTQALVQADGKLSISEFALQTVLYYRVAPHFNAALSAAPTIHSFTEIERACQQLIAALASAGHDNPADADYAFRCGYKEIARKARVTMPTALPKCSLPELETALKQLRMTNSEIKDAIASACAHTVLANGRTTHKEADLLRATFVALDHPLPAFIDNCTNK